MCNPIKRKQVFQILLKPIKCTGYSNGKIEIALEKNYIKSTQSYYQYKNHAISLDEDMSDFSIGFYEIIYAEILNGHSIINSDDSLFDIRFAGDTMNSFNTIANLFPEAGKCKKNRTASRYWPTILQTYKAQYHCLANFWLLPMEIGRKLDKDGHDILCKGSYFYGINDYMDRFLKILVSQEKFPQKRFSEKIDSFDKFEMIHFLNGSYTYGDSTIFEFSKHEADGELLVKKIIDRIKLRATVIANSKYSDALWNYFFALNLIQ